MLAAFPPTLASLAYAGGYHVHLEKNKARPVTVNGALAIEEICGGLDTVQTYYMLTEYVHIDHVGVWWMSFSVVYRIELNPIDFI